jgi:hypothetical protein
MAGSSHGGRETLEAPPAAIGSKAAKGAFPLRWPLLPHAARPARRNLSSHRRLYFHNGYKSRPKMESDHNWQMPVVLANSDAGAFVIVRSSVEAAAYLLEFWPPEHGTAFFKAIRICADALDGDVEDDEARNAFLEAAHEAKIAITVH